MRKLIAILAALCCFTLAQAVPAYPGLIRHTQPDGSTIMIRLHGDEFCHWVTDASGNVLEMDADGYYRPSTEAQIKARRAAGNIRRAAVNKARRLSPAKAGVASGQKHFLVILVEFSDVTFKSSTANADFDALLNTQGYNVNGGTGSARDFYYDNSGGYFEPIFDVYGPVQLNKDQEYYGSNDSDGNDNYPHYAVKEGCQGLDSQIDFSQYDNDGDGEVDLVFMYYAGKGEADGGGANCIWPHQWELASGGISLTLDGKTINKYACTNEIVSYGALSGKMCGIGTACHEFGHAMGLPDFYDTDYDNYNGEAGGLYDYSTMCGGSYNNSGRTPPYFNMEERMLLGWPNLAYSEFSVSGYYTLASVSNNVAYKTPTDMEGEYFVYECRSKTGWDAYIPEAGLIVYHVDKSSRIVPIYHYNNAGTAVIRDETQTAASLWNDWETYNCINENGSHPCFYVVPAGDQDKYYYTGSKFAFPGTAKKYSFTATSWNGVSSDIQLSDISYSNDQVTLYATVPSSSLNYNVIKNTGNGVYNTGNFTLELETSEAQPVSTVQWYLDDEPVGKAVAPTVKPTVNLTAGEHLIEAHLTLTSGVIKILELTITAE